jgi:hypothetical protein
MARWMLNIDGGPKRVNHAAVAIGDKVKIGGNNYFSIFINPIFRFIHLADIRLAKLAFPAISLMYIA